MPDFQLSSQSWVIKFSCLLISISPLNSDNEERGFAVWNNRSMPYKASEPLYAM